MRKATESHVRFLILLKCRTMTGWMSTIKVLPSINKKVELRIDRIITTYFQLVMSYRGPSLIVFTYLIKEFSEISYVSLLEGMRKLLFDPTKAFFSLKAFSIIKLVELI